MSEELKPCPLCESPARLENAVTECAILCNHCKLSITRRHDPIGDAAITRVTREWNTRPAQPSAGGVTEEMVERAARAVYERMPFDGDAQYKVKPPWVERGNSLKQDEARRYARAALEAALGEGDGWVKCSERMPKDHEAVLVCLTEYDDPRVIVASYYGASWTQDSSQLEANGGWDGATISGQRLCVSHWRPLPQPPATAGGEMR